MAQPSISEVVAQAVAYAMQEWQNQNQNDAPARNTERWKRAEMKKLKDIRVEKYSHTKPGYTWTLFKSQLREYLRAILQAEGRLKPVPVRQRERDGERS